LRKYKAGKRTNSVIVSVTGPGRPATVLVGSPGDLAENWRPVIVPLAKLFRFNVSLRMMQRREMVGDSGAAL
jgi:hypothetical protein